MEYHKILTLEPLKGTFLINGLWTEKTEIFKDIPEYEGRYKVSTFGRVKSLSREVKHSKGGFKTLSERILKVGINKGGYLTSGICVNGIVKQCYVAILISITFLNHKPDGTTKIVVDHKDNIKTNNWLWNLQLISHRENTSKDKKGGTSKFIGVYFDSNSEKWRAQITIGGKIKHLGHHKSEEDAHLSYESALLKIK